MSRLVAENLRVERGGITLCRDLNIAFGAGENWAILGPNGSGKTSLLHALAGFHAPDAGRVVLDGAPLSGLSPRSRALTLGVVLQDSEHAYGASVLETALSGRHPHLSRWAWEGADDIQCARSALKLVGLEGLDARQVHTLSGGERRRVDIAALLTQDPPICLWDEPSNHLDLGHQTQVLAQLAARARRPECLNIFVLHDVNLAARVCSHGLLMFPGGTHRSGPLATLLDAAVLSHLYGCEIVEMAVNGRRLFFPN